MERIVRRPEPTWLISGLISSALLIGAMVLPLWQLELVAPQYPAGLVMHAYGNRFADDSGTYYDDVREINGLNHYIGMDEIKTVTEMKLFIPGVVALIVGTLASTFVALQQRWLRRVIVAAYWFMPLFFIADLQFWLYHYGHTMDEGAALNTGAFTPKVFGTTKVWNFHSETRFEIGFYSMVAAALVITFGPLLARRAARFRRHSSRNARMATALPRGTTATIALFVVSSAVAVALFTGDAGRVAAAQDAQTLQARIDVAGPQDIVVVDGGEYNERITIDKPISLVGRNWPVIDGGGAGDIVTIASDDVILSGFELRNSGNSVSQEPAAIKVDGYDRVKITGNRIRASYFGVHITDSVAPAITGNDIGAGEGVAQERRGHGVYLWKVNGGTVSKNDIHSAADGIHLEFAEHNLIVENSVTDSRYAIHLMYAHQNSIIRNTVEHNLSGAVLMYSHDLVVKDNEFSSNRAGATGAGMLLKDNDNFFAEGNRLVRNKYGMTVEGTPQSAGTTAVFRRNTFALNDTGLALTTNSPITFVENAVIDNTVQIKAMSANAAATLSSHSAAPDSGDPLQAEAAAAPAAVWSSNGRGNFWSDYRGYDADNDGVGDRPYLPRALFAGQLEDNETLKFFQYTLAQQAIDMGAEMFPVYRYDAVIEDSHPLMTPPPGLQPASSSRLNAPLIAASIALVAIGGMIFSWAHGGSPIRLSARARAAAGGR